MCSLKIDWDHNKGFVDIWMPNYIKDVLLRFQHLAPKSPQCSPHENTPIQYGNNKEQYALEPYKSPLLDKNGIIFVHELQDRFILCSCN